MKPHFCLVMIQANELRVGNWVMDDAPSCPVFRKITPELIQYVALNGEGTLSAITLTPEILEKCGFENIMNSGLYKLRINDSFSFLISNIGSITLELHGANWDMRLKIKHIHKLQNLYFTLTGEELQINL